MPSVLKEGLVTPIFKKGDRSNPANYRGITVTTVLLKVIEHVLNIRHNAILDASQSRLQKGFTPGRSSIDAALILSECIAEAKNERKPLIVATLDAQKAFDVVDHKLLLRRLFLDGITGADWMLLRNMYTDLTSAVKWEGTLSSPFVIKQGVRQGGVLSTGHYKRYNHPLLIEMENKFTGAKIGCIRVPHVTVADDVALLTNLASEMQVMLPCTGSFANIARFVIHPNKSCILIFWEKYAQPQCASFTLNGEEMAQVDHAKHLGIHREVNNKVNVDEKITLGRRTAYSLMGAGLHSGNGLKQSVGGKLWSTYVVPRFTYGLEVLDLKAGDIKSLEQFQRKSLKQLQSLPDRTQNSISLALLGILPVESVLDKNMLNLFGRWIRTDGIEKEIAVRQLAMKCSSELSWFNKIKELLKKYNLPAPSQLLENVPTKNRWKKMVNSAINSAVESQWREDIKTKSSLRYINPDSVSVGAAHHVWTSVHDNIHDSRRAQLKCRLLTGTYTLQSNRAVFNQFAVNPTCRVCGTSPETRQHFLTECQPLHKPRDRFLKKIQSITEVDIGNMVPMYDVTQLILDPSLLFTSETIIDKIELHSRELISTLHKLRTKILLEKDRQQGLASSVFNHFRGSSSKQQRLRIQNSKKNQQKHSTSN